MLTGDKIETAKCIAIATGMNHKNEQTFTIDEKMSEITIKDKINKYQNTNRQKTMLVIDGGALAIITSNEQTNNRFFEVAKEAKSVCVCRCSPT